MIVIREEDAAGQLGNAMHKACDDRVIVVISRRENREPVVMTPLGDFESLEETMYLLRDPANRRRLSESISDIEAGRVLHRELVGCS